MSLARHLNSHGHTHRFIVTHEPEGWAVREEEDAATLLEAHRKDWHRVERDIQLFELRALALKQAGWTER